MTCLIRFIYAISLPPVDPTLAFTAPIIYDNRVLIDAVRRAASTMNPDDLPLAAFKTSALHGGFARVNLRKGQRIIEPIGPRLARLTCQQNWTPAMLHDMFLLDADGAKAGSVAWHPARFLNPSGDPSGD